MQNTNETNDDESSDDPALAALVEESVFAENEASITINDENDEAERPTAAVALSCVYSLKYTAKWPHCDWSNNELMSGYFAEFEAACDKFSSCLGFSYEIGEPSSAGGSLKFCGNEAEGGYGYGSHDYFVKGKCGGCPNTIAGLYNNETITITVDDQNQITVNMSYYNRPTATGEVTHSDATYVIGHITFKDERRYRIYYHKNEGNIYWDSPNKEYISRIWKKDSCLDGSAFISYNETSSIANNEFPTAPAPSNNGVLVPTLIIFATAISILSLLAFFYHKRKKNLQFEIRNNPQADTNEDSTKEG